MKPTTRIKMSILLVFGILFAASMCLSRSTGAQNQGGQPQNRQSPAGPDILKQEPTNTQEARPTAGGKPLPNRDEVMRRAMQYLNGRYDLSGRTDPSVTMSGGRKHIPVGPTARLKEGVTWEQLARMSPEEIKRRDLCPRGRSRRSRCEASRTRRRTCTTADC